LYILDWWYVCIVLLLCYKCL